MSSGSHKGGGGKELQEKQLVSNETHVGLGRDGVKRVKIGRKLKETNGSWT